MLFDLENLLRFVHVIGAIVLTGTGAGIAFFMLMAHRSGNAVMITHTASVVVIADMIFTASAAILQPITGLWLAHETGWPWSTGWIMVSILLYLLVGLFWLPVLWMQTRMRDLACEAVIENAPLGAAYHKLFRLWFACGVPAFVSMLTIIWLMLVRPDIQTF